ncbi:MAG: carboxypeptidase regulatory-like domain-containing protein [Bryobacterales bacterium]|nr:carboxypeptidase regulatory-like domain-containing protein [Bryobacterales bacterium]MBV9399352.1 carboxypeptidase regulatory-like domain-containing protein [Bryobacterales bacterium]
MLKTKSLLFAGAVVIGIAGYLVAPRAGLNAQPSTQVKVKADEIGGVVSSSKGPEAGVWVIAETTDLPTRYIKEVVTDDRGRYLIPELPKAKYTVWARGYGLVDSPKAQTEPGKQVDLKPTIAPDAKTAAQLYPGNYWYSLLHIPEKNEFPGTGPTGNGINANLQAQGAWIHLVKTDSCESCHQLGNLYTRTIPPMFANFDSPAQAWARRVQSGQAGNAMVGGLSQLGPERATKEFGDWTTRIAKGELPAQAPPRPSGMERNVVITQWDWADPKAYLHDEIATDKRNPTVNANGLIYGSPEESRDALPVLDPVHSKTSWVKVPYRDANTPGQPKPLQPSTFWGDEAIWDSHTTVHNPMFDAQGRVWFTSRIRAADNPAFCKAGSDLVSAKLTPTDRSGRQLAVYDPKTQQVSLVDTCFGTHHLLFAEDANNTLWTSSGGGGGVVGWLNTKMWDQTHDAAKSQGWTALVLDTNGNGKRDAYGEVEQKVTTAPSGESLGTSSAVNSKIDSTKDTRLNAAFYGLAIGTDGSVWGSVLGFPGGIVRLTPGSNPPETALAEYYEVPYNNAKAPVSGYSPRGMDIDRNNVAWVALGSGHLASFDRRKCKGPLNGPKATGQHCPEGWTLYPTPGPNFKNVKDSGSADSHYYDWVDQFDTLGLGRNTPIITGNSSDSLIALVNGKFVVMRVPYPLGFFAKGMDGRIDDSKAGWKGKGVWTTWGTRTAFHSETGKGTMAKVVHFQIRPDPLAD